MKGKWDLEEESALFRVPSRLKRELQMQFLCPEARLCATPHCIARLKFLIMAKHGLEKKAGCKDFICLNKGFVILEFSVLSYAINHLLHLPSEI